MKAKEPLSCLLQQPKVYSKDRSIWKQVHVLCAFLKHALLDFFRFDAAPHLGGRVELGHLLGAVVPGRHPHSEEVPGTENLGILGILSLKKTREPKQIHSNF